MRIQKIRFKNLNSLVGEWEIDLAHPAYTGDGIFAITGPTGAGKTTILDAICLALYGRTPRLNRVTKSVNEIMSRQTGECFAEVTFSTEAGHFRCHWSQHRSRRKPEGELQPPRHEIAHADNGKILDVTLRGVPEQVIAVTGMDFERFTRSMLLAQGGFAAFLQAAPDERAPILEQITGTEIYSTISIRVHERRAQEQKKLDLLSAESFQAEVLSSDAEQTLRADLQGKMQAEGELELDVAWHEQAITWLLGITALEHESRCLSERQQNWQLRMTDFQAQRQRLEGARRALEVSSDYSALKIIRKNQEQEQADLTEHRRNLPQQRLAVDVAEGQLREAADRLMQAKKVRNKTLPILHNARMLDLSLATNDESVKRLRDARDSSASTLAQRQHNLRETAARAKEHERTRDALHQQLLSNSADAKLVGQLTGIQGRIDAVQDTQRSGARLQVEMGRSRQHLDRSRAKHDDEVAKYAQINRELEKSAATIVAKKKSLDGLLADQPLSVWRQRQSDLTVQKEALEKTLRAAQERTDAKRIVMALSRKKESFGVEAVGLAGQLQSLARLRAGLERESDILEENLTLHEKIGSYEQERAQLQAGQPCPLCGATEHPYDTGTIPVADQTRLRLNETKAKLKSIYEDSSNTRVRQATLAHELRLIAESEQRQIRSLERATSEVSRLCHQLPERPGPLRHSDFDEALTSWLAATTQNLAHINTTVDEGEQAEQALSAVRDIASRGRDSMALAAEAVQAAGYEHKLATQKHDRLARELDELSRQRTRLLEQLNHELDDYGLGATSVDGLDDLVSFLAIRRQQWMTWTAEHANHERKAAEFSIQMAHQAEEVSRYESELASHEQQIAALLVERKRMLEQRLSMFEGDDLDAEEGRLSVAIENAEHLHDAARQNFDAEKAQMLQTQSQIDHVLKSIDARGKTLDAQESAFALMCKQFGFVDETAFLAACLDEEQRKQIAAHAKQLDEEGVQLSAGITENSRSLKTQRQKNITASPLEELRLALDTLKLQRNGLQQEMGAIAQQIRDNEQRKRQQASRLTAIQAQERECAKWGQLHALIGSADGKKYRNFAQGLTFELVVGHANQQLYKMTDRYLLVRDDQQPLELNVMDNYQAGEIRSTKNLSGGESFIVSLALALGLSQMSSENLRVDSLFLDEGFGTLDEDALDTALETLAGLQQDGKLIGVISHVPALKERISTQIQVTPQSGGRSRLSGPGCHARSRVQA